MIPELVITFKFYKDLLRILPATPPTSLLIREFALLAFVLNKFHCKSTSKNYSNKTDFILKSCDFVIQNIVTTQSYRITSISAGSKSHLNGDIRSY